MIKVFTFFSLFYFIYFCFASNQFFESRYPSPTESTITDIVWGNDKFFAVGLDGTLLQSLDNGNTWTPCNSPIEGDYIKIMYTNGFYIQSDSINTITYSETGDCTNPSSWTIESSGNFTTNSNTQISPDPVEPNWDEGFISISNYKVYFSYSGSYGEFHEITYDYTQFQAWSATVDIDQKKWVIKFAQIPPGTITPDTTYNIYMSVFFDEFTFNQPVATTYSSKLDYGLSYSSSISSYITACDQGIIISTDGDDNWSIQNYQEDYFQFQNLVCSGSRCVGVDFNSKVYDSPDSFVSYNRLSLDLPFIEQNYPVVSYEATQNAAMFMIGSYEGIIFRSNNESLWEMVGSPPEATENFVFCDEVIFADGKFFMNCQNRILYSSDAINWTTNTFSLGGDFNAELKSLTGEENFIAGYANERKIYTSGDFGKIWNEKVSLQIYSNDNLELSNLKIIDNQWVAFGMDYWLDGGESKQAALIITSQDTSSWDLYSSDTKINDMVYDYTTSLYYGAGQGGIYSSSNLYEWTRVATVNNECTKIESNNERILALCSNSANGETDNVIQASSDFGNTWNIYYTPCQDRNVQPGMLVTVMCTGLNYINELNGFIIYSEDPAGDMYFSTDGSTYSQIDVPYAPRFFDVAAGNELFVSLAKDAVFSGPSNSFNQNTPVVNPLYNSNTDPSNDPSYDIDPGFIITEPTDSSSLFSSGFSISKQSSSNGDHDDGDNDSSGLTGGGIFGIIFGVFSILFIVAVIIVIFAIFIVHKRKKESYKREQIKLLNDENDLL